MQFFCQPTNLVDMVLGLEVLVLELILIFGFSKPYSSRKFMVVLNFVFRQEFILFHPLGVSHTNQDNRFLPTVTSYNSTSVGHLCTNISHFFLHILFHSLLWRKSFKSKLSTVQANDNGSHYNF